jgi:LPS export ABC transporter permease LptG
MTTIDRYLVGRFAATLAKTLLTLICLYVLIDLLTHRRPDILKHDVPWHIVCTYYLVTVPQVVCRIAPLSVLISALFVLGDAAQNNETTAALAGGVSLRRFVRAPVLAATVFAVGIFVMEESVGVAGTRAASNIEGNYFARDRDTKREGVSWANLEGGWTCHILKFNRLALTGEHVLIHSIRDDAVEQIEARRIYWDETVQPEGRWILEDGRWVVFDPKLNMKQAQVRITQLAAPIVEPPEDLFAVDEPPETKAAWVLARDLRKAAARGMITGPLWVDYHAKFSQPALSFVMIWLAVPFALRLRRGGLAISFGMSIVIALAYLIVFGMSMGLGQLERLSPVTAAWLANGLFFVVGVVLFLRTPT